MPSPPDTPSILRRIGQLGFVVVMMYSASNAFAQEAPDTLWTRAVCPQGEYAAWRIANIFETENDGFLVCGHYLTEDEAYGGFYMMQLDSLANLEWYRWIGDSLNGHSSPYVVKTTDNHYAFVAPDFVDFPDFYVAMYDGQGTLLWDSVYVLPDAQFVQGTCAAVDSGILVAFRNIEIPSGDEALVWMRLDPNGTVMSSDSFTLESHQLFVSDAIATSDSGYAISARSSLNGNGLNTIFIRLNSTGDTVITRIYDLQHEEHFGVLQELGNHHFLLSGNTHDGNTQHPLVSTLVELSPTGNLITIETFDVLGQAGSVGEFVQAINGGITILSSNDEEDGLIRFDSVYSVLWQSAYNFPNPYRGYYSNIWQNESGEYYLAGYFYDPNNEFHPCLGVTKLERDPSLAAENNPATLTPTTFSLSTFPNPFNSTLSITLDIPLHQEISLSLFDILGREAAVIHRGRLNSTTLNYTTPAHLSSGIYFLRAATNTQSTMQKVVLLK